MLNNPAAKSALFGFKLMAIPVSEFWGENCYGHPPLTDEMVAVAEQELGIRLPAEYVALLRVQNGGYTGGFVFPSPRPANLGNAPVTLETLNGIVLDPHHRTALNVLNPFSLPPGPLYTERLSFMRDEAGPLFRQVLLSGDGHWWATLDYRNGAVPTVAYIDVECDWEEQVAPSLAAFLDGLTRDPIVWE
jgi:SMI1 / KNR4 family (SUKH-1)